MAKVEEKTDKKAGAPPAVEHFSAEERAARGRVARSDCPRASHSSLGFADDRDPVALLEAQAPSRVPELVPIRYGRMLVSPFTFYRGAATSWRTISQLDSARRAPACSSAATRTSRTSAASRRRSARSCSTSTTSTRRFAGPFEWDVKRLATSFEVAGRDRGFSDAQRDTAVLGVVRAYREAMRGFAAMNNLEIWYSRLDAVASRGGDPGAERDQAGDKTMVARGGQGAHEGQHEGLLDG